MKANISYRQQRGRKGRKEGRREARRTDGKTRKVGRRRGRSNLLVLRDELEGLWIGRGLRVDHEASPTHRTSKA